MCMHGPEMECPAPHKPSPPFLPRAAKILPCKHELNVLGTLIGVIARAGDIKQQGMAAALLCSELCSKGIKRGLLLRRPLGAVRCVRPRQQPALGLRLAGWAGPQGPWGCAPLPWLPPGQPGCSWRATCLYARLCAGARPILPQWWLCCWPLRLCCWHLNHGTKTPHCHCIFSQAPLLGFSLPIVNVTFCLPH